MTPGLPSRSGGYALGVDLHALRIYLNDHLSGATLGADHARQLEKLSEGTPFAAEMSRIAQEIEEDRDSLLELMERLEVSRNPVKQAGAWVSEKAGRLKFGGATSDDESLGRYLALEAMSLGVAGKLSLWEALRELERSHAELSGFDFERLIGRARDQRAALERERLRTVAAAFARETETA